MATRSLAVSALLLIAFPCGAQVVCEDGKTTASSLDCCPGHKDIDTGYGKTCDGNGVDNDKIDEAINHAAGGSTSGPQSGQSSQSGQGNQNGQGSQTGQGDGTKPTGANDGKPSPTPTAGQKPVSPGQQQPASGTGGAQPGSTPSSEPKPASPGNPQQPTGGTSGGQSSPATPHQPNTPSGIDHGGGGNFGRGAAAVGSNLSLIGATMGGASHPARTMSAPAASAASGASSASPTAQAPGASQHATADTSAKSGTTGTTATGAGSAGAASGSSASPARAHAPDLNRGQSGPIDLSKPSDVARLSRTQYAAAAQAQKPSSQAALESSNGVRGGAEASSIHKALLGQVSLADPSMAASRPNFGPASFAAADYKDQARASLKAGDAQSAIGFLNQARAVSPADQEMDALLALAYSGERNYRSAVTAADEGLRSKPNDVSLLDYKAFALTRLKDFRRALAAADQALLLQPRDAAAHFNRAIALAGLGDSDGALAELSIAADLAPNLAPFLYRARRTKDLSFLFDDTDELSGSPIFQRKHRWSSPIASAVLGVAAFALLILLLRRVRRAPAALPEAPAPGLLAGHYRIGKELGAGGMGIVYEGMDTTLQRRVAIKRMREEIRGDESVRRRFVTEAKAVAKLQHPQIVDILEIVEEDDELYLIFEYVAGRTLHDRISEGRLPFEEARSLFRQVASALDHAHAHGVVHRDLKPANIMMDEDGLARVMDFGVARIREQAAATRGPSRGATTIAGTPPYMAPEQEQGKACARSDVYALGVCLYEALTGVRPFDGADATMSACKLEKAYAPASTVVTGLPQGIDDILAKALEPDPSKRLPSAGALARGLEALA